MHTKCPCCGSVNSLDSLMNNDDASAALAAVVLLSGELGKAVIKYCGLFRPSKTQLTFARMATIVNELLPAIQAQRIERHSQLYEAPIESWLYAIDVLINKRAELTLPLKSHGYLYEVMSSYKPASGISEVAPIAQGDHQHKVVTGKKAQRAALLQSMKL